MSAPDNNSSNGADAHTSTVVRKAAATFKPRARILQFLGDQLIRSPQIAAFELLKNSYDADALKAAVTLKNIENPQEACIIIEDDGSGMTFDTVLNIWLEPGTDYRSRQKSQGYRSPQFGRTPIGEKGIGRFAVHKLGRVIELVTRAADNNEVVVNLNWDDLERQDYLSNAALQVLERTPTVFVDRTGTRITISELREPWKRRSVRALSRSITAIKSPFQEPQSFVPSLQLDPDSDWLTGMLDPRYALKSALFYAQITVDPDAWTMSYEYQFTPPRSAPWIAPRKSNEGQVPLGSRAERSEQYLHELETRAVEARKDHYQPTLGIGEFTIQLYMFDLDLTTRRLLQMTDYSGISHFLKVNSGVRVYRDGIRVYDYGEAGNDWLDLDARRVNVPVDRISNRLVVGAVHLNSDSSHGLIEKTNREGFLESPSYRVFRSAVQSAIQHVMIERNRDKKKLRELGKSPRDTGESVVGAIRDLRERVNRHGLSQELGPFIDQAETEYENFREILLVTAGAGLTMTVTIHEVEKAVKALNTALDRGVERDRLIELGQHLAEVTDSLNFIFRKSGQTNERAFELVSVALRTIEYRLAYHHIEVSNAFTADNDFFVRGKRRLIVGTLLNLFDNSIYWMNAKEPPIKRLYVGPTQTFGDDPAILVADNGPGFLDPAEFLVQPFMTRKTDGIGLGLYIANEVMKSHRGHLVFAKHTEVDIPPEYDGACVALVFKAK